MSKVQRNFSIDADVSHWIDHSCGEKRLSASAFVNQRLWDAYKDEISRAYKRKTEELETM